MKGRISGMGLLILGTLLISCEDQRNNYFYKDYQETVDMDVWDVISNSDDSAGYPQYSKFVEYCKEYGLDSIINNGLTHTLFIPVNAAFENLEDDTSNILDVLSYHISESMFLLNNVKERRKLQTYLRKYAVIEHKNNHYFINGIPIAKSGSLCKDGTFYEIEEVSLPIPNLYEYIAAANPIIGEYIDMQDTVFLDIQRSTPIGFDEETGNTIYDSVFTSLNLFQEKYFPVKEEFRSKSATVLLFNHNQYETALTEMALDLNIDGFNTYEDIPRAWQINELLPLLINNGIFDGSMAYEDFLPGELQNIAGDSVRIDPGNIDPDSRFICSNGVGFTYLNFTIPDSLYNEYRIEGESMVDSLGSNIWAWKTDDFGIKTEGETFYPKQMYSNDASGDSLVSVEFPFNYNQTYSFSFLMRDVLPGKYIFRWRASYRPSGNMEVYINENDTPIRTYDLFDLRKSVPSITVFGERYNPSNNINTFDAWATMEEYGDVRITLKYIDAGFAKTNGFSIDYISLTRASE